MRVTQQMIDQKMQTLNAVLRRPARHWEVGSKGMNVGHLYLTSLGYGHRLVEIVSPQGAERAWSDVMSTKREIFDYLHGVLNGISLRNATLVVESTGGSFS